MALHPVSPHRCNKRFQEHLAELKRRQDVENLRVPMIDFRIFPPDKDPNSAPVTIEELKKLVRAWKLHDVRGFWKSHTEKEDLIRVCLKYMEKTKYRDLLQVRVVTPIPPTTSKRRPRPLPPPQPQDPNKEATRALKPYMGDIFGNNPVDGAIVYLSRFELSKSHKKKNPGKAGRSMFQVLPSMFRPTGDSDSDEEINAEDKHAQHTFVTIADQIYGFSLSEGSEAKIVEEGALRVLLKLSKLEVIAVAKRCAAAICNLSMCKESRRGFFKAFALDCITHLLTNFAEDEEVVQCCLLALASLSSEVGQEERIFRDFAAALPRIGSRIHETSLRRTACAYTLCNCLESTVRPYVVVQLLSLLKALDPSNAETKPVLARVALTLSTFEESRHAMVDGGLTAILSSVVNHSISLRKVEEENMPIIRQVAMALCNLSCFSDGRDRMITDGAVRASVLMAGSNMEEQCIASCLNTMLNLSALPHHTPVFLLNKAVVLLSELAFRLNRRDNLLTLADILHNLASASDPPTALDKMVQGGAHKALLRLISPLTHGVDRDVELVSLRALCTLLIEPVNQSTVLGANAIPDVILVCKTHIDDVDLLGCCAAIIFNVSLHLSFLESTDDTTIQQVLTFMSQSMDEALRMTSVRTLTLLSRHQRTCEMLARGGLLSRLHNLISMNDKEILWHCATLLSCNARLGPIQSSPPSVTPAAPSPMLMSVVKAVASPRGAAALAPTASVLSRAERLHEIVTLLSTLVEQSQAEMRTLIKCAEAVYGISQDEERPEVDALLRLAQQLSSKCSKEPEVVFLVGAIIFQLSGCLRTKTIVSMDATILNMLIRMMRGAAAPTQLNSAKALCNLACDRDCARVMIRNKSIQDFVVITVLRATNSIIKEICVATLFNLLSHEGFREECIQEGILWAIIKISGDCKAAQRLCARAIFNLSFDMLAQTKMVEMGVAKCLALITQQQDAGEQQTRRHCIGVLYNLSFEYADVMLGHHSSEVANPVVHSLIELSAYLEDPEDELFCAIIVRNLSESGEEHRRLAVQEGVTKVLAKLAASTCQSDASIASLVAFNNYSRSKECRLIMVDDHAISCLSSLLVKQEDLTKACLIMSCLRDFTFSSALRKKTALSRVVAACRTVVERWAVLHVPPKGGEMEPAAVALGQMVMRIMSTLSFQTDTVPILQTEGIAYIITTVLEHVPLEPVVALDFTTAASNISFHEDCLKDMLTCAPASALRTCLRILSRREEILVSIRPSPHNPLMETVDGGGIDNTSSNSRRKNAPSKRSVTSDPLAVRELSGVEEDIAIIIRNMSAFPAVAELACKCEEVKSVLDKLSNLRTSPASLTVLSHLSVAMLNFFRIPYCERFLNTRGASSVLLKIGQLEGLPENITRMCSLAFSYQKHRTMEEYQTGAMNALASLLKTTDVDRSTADTGPFTKPSPPEDYFMYEAKLLSGLPDDPLVASSSSQGTTPPITYREVPNWDVIEYDVSLEPYMFGPYEPPIDTAPIRPPHTARTFVNTIGNFQKLVVPLTKFHLANDTAATTTNDACDAPPVASSSSSQGNDVSPVIAAADHPLSTPVPTPVGGNTEGPSTVHHKVTISPAPPATSRPVRTRAVKITINTNLDS